MIITSVPNITPAFTITPTSPILSRMIEAAVKDLTVRESSIAAPDRAAPVEPADKAVQAHGSLDIKA